MLKICNNCYADKATASTFCNKYFWHGLVSDKKNLFWKKRRNHACMVMSWHFEWLDNWIIIIKKLINHNSVHNKFHTSLSIYGYVTLFRDTSNWKMPAFTIFFDWEAVGDCYVFIFLYIFFLQVCEACHLRCCAWIGNNMFVSLPMCVFGSRS